jgi:putative PIG3 family NAD(P)H quinone oxidoreductase
MRAAVIVQFGGPEGLQVREVAVPAPRDREILVRVRASALNRADMLQRLGRYPPPNDVPQDIPGMEFAGEVVGRGREASRWHIGDRVFGIVGGGAHAEYLTVHEDAIAAIPAGLDWHQAGAIPEAFITAHDALVTQAGLRAGDSVVVHAAGSGVGLAAVQIVRAWGALAYGTSRTADKLERAREYGLTDGVVLEQSPAALAPAVAEWTSQRGVDVVLDLVGGPYVSVSVEALAMKGRLMLVGAVGGAQASIDIRRILGKRLTLCGTVLRARSLDEKIVATRAFAEQVLPLFATGQLRAVIDSVFPLDRIADAHRRMESNGTFGKVVLDMGASDN